MSAPAQVTEAHRQIARFIGRGTVGEYPQDAEHDAQLIADSEAKALCELAMVAAASADRNVSLRLENAQVRAVFPKILAALGNGACCAPDVSVEFIKAIPNEVAGVVAQLRAEVAWWKNWHDENEKMEDGIAVKVQATIDGLRAEVERLKAKISNQADRIRYLEGATNHATGTPLSQAIARAEEAEHDCRVLSCQLTDAQAELDGIRALADRRNKRDHSQDTAHPLVAALDQALDIAQAELADLKANNRFQRGHSAGYAEAKADCEAELAAERARLDWLEYDRDTLDAMMKKDAAMKEETK